MSFTEFYKQHPAFVIAFTVICAAAIGIDGMLMYKRVRYAQEIHRLRAGMTDFERRQADAMSASAQEKVAVEMELLRRQSRGTKDIHLSVSVDSGAMYLEREGAVLRPFAVSVGPERRVGTPPDTLHIATPRGTRTIEQIIGRSDKWVVPAWVFGERGVPTPEERSIAGALGPIAIVLSGGTVIYSMPASGPLADSSYVLPGAVRASAEDLRAILPNIKRGTTVYFF
ncbi:MAG: L,D-transpeptidase [Gemmatimonadota bacterium]|nr:L,D-transpeptidase [Gemmatimonadota bacterium]